MKTLVQQSVNSISSQMHSDLWNAIIKMFENDGIDCMNEKDSIRLYTYHDGTSHLTYKGKPYCTWSSAKIDFGLPDENNLTVKFEIILKKL